MISLRKEMSEVSEKSTTVRSLTLILAFLFITLTLLTSAYIIIESGHECEGEECHICRTIDLCEAILLGNGATVIFDTVIFSVCLSNFLILLSEKENDNTKSLISLKVRLND